MGWAWMKGLLDRLGAPELDWVQVEITTRCDARCVYCPRTAQGSRWPARDMPLELFRSLLRCLGQTRQAHLQGWGEPLRHPNFLEMVRLCRDKGLAVSTTTNGNALDDAMARSLVDLEVATLGVSLAGARADTNDALRRGTSLDRLARGLASLTEHKARASRDLPEVHLAYLDLSQDPEELFALPGLARKLGITKIMLSAPSPRTTPDLPGWPTVRRSEAEGEATYLELARRAAELGLDVFWTARLHRESGRLCTENPTGACVVGVDGLVTPCVFCMSALDARPMIFGDINQQSLTDIWHSGAYADFRALFAPPGPSDQETWPEACARCPLRACGVRA